VAEAVIHTQDDERRPTRLLRLSLSVLSIICRQIHILFSSIFILSHLLDLISFFFAPLFLVANFSLSRQQFADTVSLVQKEIVELRTIEEIEKEAEGNKMIEFDPSQFQHIKLGLHVAQSVFIFVSWCITIAVFRSSASIDGRAGWYFGLVRPLHSHPLFRSSLFLLDC
jgi:hypothetical protein